MKHEDLDYTTLHAWGDILWGDHSPLKDHLHPDTIALFMNSKNAGMGNYLGYRPYGSTHIFRETVGRNSQLLSIVGLGTDMRAEAFFDERLTQSFWAEGAMLKCGGVMFLNPIERTPDEIDAWVTIDLTDICPGAIGILAEIGRDYGGGATGIRKHGSTDDRRDQCGHYWAVIGCDESQKIDFWGSQFLTWKNRLWILGYITANASFLTNALDVTPFWPDFYQIATIPAPGGLAFLEVISDRLYQNYAVRSTGSAYDVFAETSGRHSWAIVPVDALGQFEVKVSDPRLKIYYIGEGH